MLSSILTVVSRTGFFAKDNNKSNYCHHFHCHLLQKIPNLIESIDILVPLYIYGQIDGHVDRSIIRLLTARLWGHLHGMRWVRCSRELCNVVPWCTTTSVQRQSGNGGGKGRERPLKTHPGNCTPLFCPQTTQHNLVTWPCLAAMDVGVGFNDHYLFSFLSFCVVILSEMSSPAIWSSSFYGRNLQRYR